MCPANEPILHRSLKNRYMPTIMRGLKKKKKNSNVAFTDKML